MSRPTTAAATTATASGPSLRRTRQTLARYDSRRSSGISSSVERELPKLERRVRFPYPASKQSREMPADLAFPSLVLQDQRDVVVRSRFDFPGGCESRSGALGLGAAV